VDPTRPESLGSSIHFSCGYEVSKIEKTSDQIVVHFRKHLYRLGYVYLYIPRPKVDEIEVSVAGRTVALEAVGNTPNFKAKTSLLDE
jgi:hypothetical protein